MDLIYPFLTWTQDRCITLLGQLRASRDTELNWEACWTQYSGRGFYFHPRGYGSYVFPDMCEKGGKLPALSCCDLLPGRAVGDAGDRSQEPRETAASEDQLAGRVSTLEAPGGGDGCCSGTGP